MALHIALLDGQLHDRARFSRGVPTLDAYLQQQAAQHQRDGIATTHVLAVAADATGKGFGRLLVGHAANCALALREKLSVRVLLVDALNEGAARYYRAYGFRQTMVASHVLYLPLARAAAPVARTKNNATMDTHHRAQRERDGRQCQH